MLHKLLPSLGGIFFAMLCSIAPSQKMQSFGKRGQLAAVDFEEGGAQSAQVEMDLLLTPHTHELL